MNLKFFKYTFFLLFFIFMQTQSLAQWDDAILLKSNGYEFYEWKNDFYSPNASSDNYITYFLFIGTELHVYYQGREPYEIDDNSFTSFDLDIIEANSTDSYVEFSTTNSKRKIFVDFEESMLGMFLSKEAGRYQKLYEFPCVLIDENNISDVISSLPLVATEFINQIVNVFTESSKRVDRGKVNSGNFYVEFDNDSEHYREYGSGDLDGWEYGLYQGEYKVKNLAPERGNYIAEPLQYDGSVVYASSDKDYSITSRVWTKSGDIYIIYDKDTEDSVSSDFKYILINGDNQEFKVGQKIDGEWDDASWEDDSIIKSGYNTVKIEKRGSYHYYYINEKKVGEEYYGNKSGGYFGFGGGSTFNHDIKSVIYFDYYRVNIE